MKIKRFLENNIEKERLTIVRECFFNITDDFDCQIKEINNSFIKININIGEAIIVDDIEDVKDLSNRYEIISKLYKEIYMSIKRLEEYDLNFFEISSKNEQEIKINCYFKTSNINDFLFYPNEYTIAQDKNKLKLFFKKTFNVVVKNSNISEEFDNDADYNIVLNIECENIPQNTNKIIEDFFNSLKHINGQKLFRNIFIRHNYISLLPTYTINNYQE